MEIGEFFLENFGRRTVGILKHPLLWRWVGGLNRCSPHRAYPCYIFSEQIKIKPYSF
nr:MAG TPA: hypothetical protein [Ackermannviridae sp.]